MVNRNFQTEIAKMIPIPPFFLARSPFLKRWKSQTKGNKHLDRLTLNKQTQQIQNNSAIISPRLDTMLRMQGTTRLAIAHDVYNGETAPQIQSMLQQGFYTVLPALILRGHENQGNPRNTPFIKQLVELVEDAQVPRQFPMIITGFDYELAPEDTIGYGLKAIARDDFSARTDKAFKGENNGRKFTRVNENGAPDYSKDGKFTSYTNDCSTLSRLGVGSGSGLDSGGDGLGSTGGLGRVVLLPAEGAREILDAKFNSLRKTKEADIKRIEQAYAKAEKLYKELTQ